MKRPQPPAGFEPFEWSRSKDERGQTRQACPNCGGHGRIWDGGGWTDPAAQRAYEDGVASGVILQGAGDPTISYEGTPILCHWSRYGTGRCFDCGCRYWHDFVGAGREWQYYFEPTRGQLGLFGYAGRASL